MFLEHLLCAQVTFYILGTSVCAQSCPILCDPMGCSPPVSSVHGVSQTRILEWVVISFSMGSSPPRAWTWVSCIGRQILLPLHYLGSGREHQWGQPTSALLSLCKEVLSLLRKSSIWLFFTSSEIELKQNVNFAISIFYEGRNLQNLMQHL